MRRVINRHSCFSLYAGTIITHTQFSYSLCMFRWQGMFNGSLFFVSPITWNTTLSISTGKLLYFGQHFNSNSQEFQEEAQKRIVRGPESSVCSHSQEMSHKCVSRAEASPLPHPTSYLICSMSVQVLVFLARHWSSDSPQVIINLPISLSFDCLRLMSFWNGAEHL